MKFDLMYYVDRLILKVSDSFITKPLLNIIELLEYFPLSVVPADINLER